MLVQRLGVKNETFSSVESKQSDCCTLRFSVRTWSQTFPATGVWLRFCSSLLPIWSPCLWGLHQWLELIGDQTVFKGMRDRCRSHACPPLSCNPSVSALSAPLSSCWYLRLKKPSWREHTHVHMHFHTIFKHSWSAKTWMSFLVFLILICICWWTVGTFMEILLLLFINYFVAWTKKRMHRSTKTNVKL